MGPREYVIAGIICRGDVDPAEPLVCRVPGFAMEWMALGKSSPSLEVGCGRTEKCWGWAPPHPVKSSASHDGCRSLAVAGNAAGSRWWALDEIRSDEIESCSPNHVSLGALVEERGLGRAARLRFSPAREMLEQEALRLVATHARAERYLELSV